MEDNFIRSMSAMPGEDQLEESAQEVAELKEWGTPMLEEEAVYENETSEGEYSEPMENSLENDTPLVFTDDPAEALQESQEPVTAPVPSETVPAKKHRSRFAILLRKIRKRLRRFFRRLSRLPAKTLIILGASLAAVMLIIILLAIFLPKKEKPAPVQPESPITSIADLEDEASTGDEVDPVDVDNPDDTEGITQDFSQLELPDGRTYLALNDSYPIIADIQKRLVELGYMDMPVVDGVSGVTTVYGPATQKAVKKFQWCNGLSADGMLGQSSYELLMSSDAKAIQLANSISDSLFKDDTKKLQERLIELGYLSGSASGKFVDSTTTALKAFQKANGLVEDGIAGLKTLEILYSDSAK